jgi:hypothetical protein
VIFRATARGSYQQLKRYSTELSDMPPWLRGVGWLAGTQPRDPAKIRLTRNFLARKEAEYETLRAEIVGLRYELSRPDVSNIAANCGPRV